MQRRSLGRFFNIALGVITLGAIKFPWADKSRDKSCPRNNVSLHNSDERSDPPQLDLHGRKEDREQHDHRIQEKVYWIAYILLSGATLGTAIAAAIFAWLAYKAADDQARTARKAFVESDRPIIDIGFSQIDVIGKARSYNPNIVLSVNNIGSKPGYVRVILANVKAGNKIIGRCGTALGSRMVASSASLTAPCISQTLDTTQVNKINTELNNYLIVYGLVNYKSLTGFCWLKKFKMFWSKDSEYLAGHFYPDATEETNDEVPVGCSAIIGLDD